MTHTHTHRLTHKMLPALNLHSVFLFLDIFYSLFLIFQSVMGGFNGNKELKTLKNQKKAKEIESQLHFTQGTKMT